MTAVRRALLHRGSVVVKRDGRAAMLLLYSASQVQHAADDSGLLLRVNGVCDSDARRYAGVEAREGAAERAAW
jgi:hypothetical protein